MIVLESSGHEEGRVCCDVNPDYAFTHCLHLHLDENWAQVTDRMGFTVKFDSVIAQRGSDVIACNDLFCLELLNLRFVNNEIGKRNLRSYRENKYAICEKCVDRHKN